MKTFKDINQNNYMSSEKEKKNCFVKKGRKIVLEFTPQEYEEFTKDGIPTDLELNVKGKNSNNMDTKNTVNEHDPEISDEEREIIRRSDAEEQNNA